MIYIAFKTVKKMFESFQQSISLSSMNNQKSTIVDLDNKLIFNLSSKLFVQHRIKINIVL